LSEVWRRRFQTETACGAVKRHFENDINWSFL